MSINWNVISGRIRLLYTQDDMVKYRFSDPKLNLYLQCLKTFLDTKSPLFVSNEGEGKGKNISKNALLLYFYYPSQGSR